MNRKNTLIKMKPLLFTLLLLFTASVIADNDDINKWVDKTTTQLNEIENKLTNKHLVYEINDNDLKLLSQIQGHAQKCIDTTKTDLEIAEKNLKALGDAVAGEPDDVTKKREGLKKKIDNLKNKINSCQLKLIQSNSLTQTLKTQINKEISRHLFTRTSTFITALTELANVTNKQTIFNISQIKWEIYLKKDLIALIAGSLLIALLMRLLLLKHLIPEKINDNDEFDGLLLALKSCFIRFSPIIVPLVSLLIYFNVNPNIVNKAFSLHVINSLLGALGIYLIIRSTLTPCKPAQQFFLNSDLVARLLSHNLTIMLFLSWLAYLILKMPLNDFLDINLIYVIRVLLLGALVLISNLVLWNIRKYKFALLPSWLRIIIILILFISLLVELLGYRNLSVFLMTGTVGTLASFAIAIALNRISADFFDQLDKGNQVWQQQIRQALNVQKGEAIPGLMWLRFLLALVIWGGFIFATLHSWGLSQQSELILMEGFNQGFNIGSFHIVPINILFAIFVFSLIVGLSRLFQRKVAKPWINHTHLDRGARDAVLTIIGYIGFILAILFALSIAGIEFKNLAVIAGALSVGIGFGLQNIVNNFVSGLILLFERPIRSGDWVEVGDTRGYVKSINIRSTEIQTFDRADVIVPNSELISSQVTNWMLHDKIGRLILSIGVAYGSDVEKVRDILFGIINDHSEVITNSHAITPPRVLFLEFGDSSLNFEMRFFLKDISQRRTVTSDINFAIDKAFREANIEIPFPQQDIHIKSFTKNN